MKLIICAELLLFAAISALPLDQEEPKSLLPLDRGIPQDSIETLEISTDGPEENTARAKKSYPGSGGGTICMQIENGPYESPITICRDEPSYGSGYYNEGSNFGGEHKGAGFYGPGSYGVARSHLSSYGGKPSGYGLNTEYGHVGERPYDAMQSQPAGLGGGLGLGHGAGFAGSYDVANSHLSGYGGKPTLGFGSEYGHLRGRPYGAGPYGVIQSNHAGNEGGLGLGLSDRYQPEYGYGPLNVEPINPSGIFPLGQPNVHSGAQHHVPHYRSGELEMADYITRGILTSLGARSTHEPSYRTGSYSGHSSQYLGRPLPGPGPAQSGLFNSHGGYAVPPYYGTCQSNILPGSPMPNSYGEYSQFSHHGPTGYKSNVENTDNRDQSTKKLYANTNPSELHGTRDEDIKVQKDMKAQMN